MTNDAISRVNPKDKNRQHLKLSYNGGGRITVNGEDKTNGTRNKKFRSIENIGSISYFEIREENDMFDQPACDSGESYWPSLDATDLDVCQDNGLTAFADYTNGGDGALYTKDVPYQNI